MKMVFTEEEYVVLAKSAERLNRARSSLTGKEWNKPEHKVVKQFNNKFSLTTRLDGEAQVVVLDRNILRVIQEVSEMSKKALLESVIPEYERRGLGNDKNLEYFNKAKALVKIYEDILKKVETHL